MAQGFASGFRDGYGLVQKTINDDRENTLREKKLADDAAYRDEQLDLSRERNRLTAENNRAAQAYRTASLEEQKRQFGVKEERAATEFEANREIREMDAKTRGVTADTANRNAKARELAETRKDAELRLTRDANTISQLYEISQLPVDQQEQYDDFVTNAFASLKGSKALDLNVMMRSDFKQYGAEIGSAIQQIAGGEDVELKPSMLAALTDTLDIHNSSLVGKEIDSTFSNAPPEMRAGGFTVEDITVADVKQDGTSFGADLSVKVRGPDGEISYYYPKLTEFRGGSSSPLALDFGETMQGIAGRSYMMNEMKANPLFVQMVEKEKIKEFGGADKLATAVRTETDRIYKLIGDQNTIANSALSNDTNGIISVGEDVGEILANRDEVKDRVRSQLLYGKSTQSEVTDSESFLEDVRTALGSATIEMPSKGTQRTRGGPSGRNSVSTRDVPVSSLVDIDAIDRQTLARLFHLGDNGSFRGANVPTVLDLLRYTGP